ncbi:MAG TPA: hypothetical protein VGF48_17760 [Thermoanaerobaculia bacterium]|jgi:hypothetical protein
MTRSAALALLGLLLAIALFPVWDRPAPEGQLPGLATKLNFDAQGPFRWVAGLIVLPLLLPLLFARKKAVAPPPRSKTMRRSFVLVPVFLAAFLVTMELFPKLDLGHCILVALAVVFLFARVRIPRRALAFVIYPLLLYGYCHATYVITAERAPRVSMFEDGHSLMPAAEYLRGERPYVDMLPGHGLLEDGFFDYLALHVVQPEIGSTLRARFVVGCFNAVALYFLVFAATASGEAAMLAVLFAISGGMLTPVIRVLPALIALAFLMQFARTRNARWLIGAGFFNVVQGAMSIDFAFYTLVTLVVAVVRQRRGWKHAAIGILAGVVPLFGAFALFGILGAFFRGTFVEVLSLGPVYTLGMFAKPQHWRETALYALWCLAAIFAGATVVRRPMRRTEPLFLIAIWMMLAAISYAERQHLYWHWLAPAFVAGGVWLLMRRRHALAPLTMVAAIVIAAPMTHLTVVHTFRHAQGSLDPRWRPVPNVPRARGALFLDYDRRVIASVARYLPTLAPDETFLDFTNRGLLYFLFDRDCPIRYYEVAFYETEERQREVITALEANPKIRAVLVPGPIGAYPVDGVRNRDRAPLVWAYLERHFRPDFAEGDVVFWRR